ncbi:MAG: Ppx/GppA family phosphatase [Actinomycetota bacterium]|nr:Ppx/GppA family phosphatase [Actinomycetota bacterium]
MRLGVLDVGSNTVHLLVVDAQHSGRPLPAASEKTVLRLAEHIEPDGRLSAKGADSLLATVKRAGEAAEDLGVEDLVAFATSAVRDATNADDVLARVRAETGVPLKVLSGTDEARYTFLAVRRWFGWSAGRLLCLDIGGGSLELAVGMDEEPEVAISLPLGAGRLTRERLPGDPPKQKDLRELRKYVRAELGRNVRQLTKGGKPDRVVATSKTFRSLARIAGAAPYSEGPYVRRVLTAQGVRDVLGTVAGMTVKERAGLPGVSPERAAQLAAGAIVADAALDLLGVQEAQLCPWALREGLILQRLDQLPAG